MPNLQMNYVRRSVVRRILEWQNHEFDVQPFMTLSIIPRKWSSRAVRRKIWVSKSDSDIYLNFMSYDDAPSHYESDGGAACHYFQSA